MRQEGFAWRSVRRRVRLPLPPADDGVGSIFMPTYVAATLPVAGPSERGEVVARGSSTPASKPKRARARASAVVRGHHRIMAPVQRYKAGRRAGEQASGNGTPVNSGVLFPLARSPARLSALRETAAASAPARAKGPL